MKLIYNILSPVILLGLMFLFLEQSLSSQSYPTVFVSRNLVQGGNFYYQQSGLLPGMGPFSRFKVVGGRLLVREANNTVRVLVDSTMNFNGITLFDVSDPSVFWDASKVLFAGVEHRDSSWRIYEINSSGTGFRKITFTNRNLNLSQFGPIAYKFTRYDDIDPCYLPDGRICFASTRYPSLSEFGGARTTNLYIINADLTNLHRITTERNSAEEPTIDPLTGKIVFSRWWLNIDRPSLITPNGLTRDSALAVTNDIANVWQSARIRPDGDVLELYAGTGNFRNGLHNYKPYVMSDGRLIGTFVPHTPMYFTSGSTGLRWFNQGVDYPNHIIGVNQSTMQLYIQNPPSYGTMQPPYAADPAQLPNGKILFSYAAQVENQDYGLYTVNLDGSGLQLYFDIPGKLELNAELLLAKQAPPVLPDLVTEISDELPPTADPQTWYKNGGFRFDCVNMFTNGDVDEPMQDAPPIRKHAKIKFFLNFQRMDSLGRDTALFLAQISVFHSGQISFDNAPADVPMFEQVVDSAGKVIVGSNGQVAHVVGMNYARFGIGTKCVGCHAGHTTIPVPPNLSEGQFFNTSTSATVTQSSFKFVNDSLQYPGKKVIDRKARNDTLTVNWIATGSNNEFVNLKWNVPIDVRRVILYNIRPNTSNNTNIQVSDCEVLFYYLSNQVAGIPSTGVISVNGSTFNVAGTPKIDEMKVIVKAFTGLIEGQSVAGLAEVETNARISFYDIFGIKQISLIADKFSLYQNYPNPFNPSTKIKYSIPFQSSSLHNVKLVVYDVTGREVTELINQQQRSGVYEVDFNANSIASGIYFYRLSVDDKYSEVRKMVVVK
ncbi:MAG: T9SS type A sorting domain-containing protein [Chlorobi bacterium]|nr:T9SS type A sorting domain-containing protein [Chlorobiota bacterium]